MKIYIGKGETLTVAAPANVSSGDPLLIGAAIFGIAVKDALSTFPVAIVTSGVFEGVAKATSQVWAVGAIIYWDDTAKKFTTTSSGNTRVGVATVAAQSADTTGTVKLVGVVQ